MELANFAILNLLVIVVGLYGGIFIFAKHQKLSKVFLAIAVIGFIVFIGFLLTLFPHELRLRLLAGITLFEVGLAVWAHRIHHFKDKREAKKMNMSLPEYLEWKNETIQTIKTNLEAQGTLNYENMQAGFRQERAKMIKTQ